MTKVSDVPVLSTCEILLLAVLTVVTGQLTQNKNYELWWCRKFPADIEVRMVVPVFCRV